MDQEYMNALGSSFLKELTEIQKEAMDKKALLGGALRFLSSGAKGLGKALKVPAGTSMAKRVGGAGAARAGGLKQHVKKIYEAGKAGGGTLGGAKALARSRYGQMAAIPALAAGGLYAAS